MATTTAAAPLVEVQASPAKYRINLTKEEAPQHCTYPYVLRYALSGPQAGPAAADQPGTALPMDHTHTAPTHTTPLCRGYRAGGDYKRCMQAAFEMHTETLNAWVGWGFPSRGLCMMTLQWLPMPSSKLDAPSAQQLCCIRRSNELDLCSRGCPGRIKASAPVHTLARQPPMHADPLLCWPLQPLCMFAACRPWWLAAWSA